MTSTQPTDRFGAFGGRYVPETLIPALDELEAEYAAAQHDESFRRELSTMLSTYVGRPSPLSDAPRGCPASSKFNPSELATTRKAGSCGCLAPNRAGAA